MDVNPGSIGKQSRAKGGFSIIYVRARPGAAGSAVIGYDVQYFGWLRIVACCTPRGLIRGFLSNKMRLVADLGASFGDLRNVTCLVLWASWISTLTRCHRMNQWARPYLLNNFKQDTSPLTSVSPIYLSSFVSTASVFCAFRTRFSVSFLHLHPAWSYLSGQYR